MPACRACNNAKSQLEHYLATVLLFGGRHADAHANLLTMGERRLAKNAALHRVLQRGETRAWTRTESGLAVPTTALPIDDTQVTEFFEFATKGLVRFEFGQTLGRDDFTEVKMMTDIAGLPIFRDMLTRNCAARVQRDLGVGAISYEGAQGIDNPHVTVWLMRIFGGLSFLEDDGREYRTQVGAMTGPRRVADRAAMTSKWLEGRGTVR